MSSAVLASRVQTSLAVEDRGCLADMGWLVVKWAWRGAAGLVAWRRLFFVALAGMVVAGARVVVDGVSV